MGALIHAVQRGAFVGGRVVREQRVRVAVQRVARIALHHKARLTCKAELCHHCIQIGRFGIAAGGQQHLSAVFQIGLQLRDLIHKAVSCKIRSGVADDEQITVLRDGAGEQIQRLGIDILRLERLGQ